VGHVTQCKKKKRIRKKLKVFKNCSFGRTTPWPNPLFLFIIIIRGFGYEGGQFFFFLLFSLSPWGGSTTPMIPPQGPKPSQFFLFFIFHFF